MSDDPGDAADRLLPIPAETPAPSAMEVPGFWTILGQKVLRGLKSAGGTIAGALDAIDPDVRRDLGRLPLMALTVLGPRHRPIEARPDDGHRPILFVHGLGGHPGNFLPLRGWLLTHGRRRTYAVGLPAGDDLTELGIRLSEVIAEIVSVNDLGEDGQIDIVAHSMGGVVSRLALLDVETSHRVHTLVTLGTPHGGTHPARFGGAARVVDLRPDSAVMQRLSHQVPWHAATRLVCLWSPSDPIMQPPETARVDGAINHELPDMTHLQTLLDRRAWRIVKAALDGGPIEPESGETDRP